MKSKQQPKTYVEYVSLIIDGDNYGITKEAKESSKEKFSNWDKSLLMIFKKAGFLRRWLHRWFIFRKKHYIFEWQSAKDPTGMELVFSSAFTPPFPSLHDMPEWGLSTRMADLMILWGVSVRDSSKYRVIVKNHFVNHKMVRGIIEFDLYKLRS